MFGIKLDVHYLKTIGLFVLTVFSAFLYFTGNISLGDLSKTIEDNDTTINNLKTEYTKLDQDLKKFNIKINSIDKEFVFEKKNFGVYKLMMYFDKYKDSYDFKHIVEQNEKKLTNEYFQHEVQFQIEYKSSAQIKDFLNIIENKYHNNFIEGRFSKNELILKYLFYGKVNEKR